MPTNLKQGRKLIAGRSVRWSDERAAEAYARGLWVRYTLADTLRQTSRRTPRRILLIDGGRRIDAETLHAQAAALARALLARAPVGSVVSYVLPNWYEAIVIYLAATLGGMVVNPILPSLRDRELQFILSDADSRIVFVPSSFRGHDYAGMMSRVTGQLSRPPEVVVLRGDPGVHTPYESLSGQKEPGEELPALDPDSVRMVLYTSGTTGRPKGVLHSHNSIHALICQVRDNWLADPGDTFLVPSPVGHITGSFCAIECPLILGTTAVLMDHWNANDAVALLEAERCTHMVGATPFLEQLLAAARRAGTRLPHLKLFACGGASVPPSLVHGAAGYFDRAVVTRVYGSTEVPLITVGVTDRDDAAHAADTDGRPHLAEIKLVDHPAARAGEGEIYARGPQMLVGYLNAHDEAGAFDVEGYFRTGDIARWVDDAYLEVTGRAKDIIIRNGENISPKEVEDVLIGHPDIVEVAIVGLPDPRTGERACAVIVPKSLPGPDIASLRSFLDSQGMATFKVPEEVVIRDALPKNDAGKILKHKIRAELAHGVSE
jgi:acyl-CoA synthetase (AMP-forming)/AMP-acid ligase II